MYIWYIGNIYCENYIYYIYYIYIYILSIIYDILEYHIFKNIKKNA